MNFWCKLGKVSDPFTATTHDSPTTSEGGLSGIPETMDDLSGVSQSRVKSVSKVAINAIDRDSGFVPDWIHIRFSRFILSPHMQFYRKRANCHGPRERDPAPTDSGPLHALVSGKATREYVGLALDHGTL